MIAVAQISSKLLRVRSEKTITRNGSIRYAEFDTLGRIVKMTCIIASQY